MIQNWHVQKPAAVSAGGIVVAQRADAAEIGASMLRRGGNAVDAAVATAFALAALEPWNTGLGGIGYMVVHRPGNGPQVVDFAAVSPRRLDPMAFPLAGEPGADLFAWPRVEGDRNIHGPLAIAVPGAVDGYGLALERFGSLAWHDVIAPAIELAEQGLPVDWFVTLKILAAAADLRRYAAGSRIWLRNDLPPLAEAGLPAPRIMLDGLAESLRRIARHGRRELYEGAVAKRLAADIAADGGVLAPEDLAKYRARIVSPTLFTYRRETIAAGPALTAGPTLRDVLDGLETGRLNGTPDAHFFRALATSLDKAYARRLAGMGDVERRDSSTTHISAVDRDGTAVSLTSTMLSNFGSRYVSPSTGILMNNGIMWFDPVPRRPNSIGPSKRPLSNMCPTVVSREERPWLVLGASGGRKIVGAVAQLLSFTVDFRLDAAAAAHHPRIDVSGGSKVLADPRLGAEILTELRAHFETVETEHTAYPIEFACPSLIVRRESGDWAGITDVMTPRSGAVAG